jgi:hypothetical protein
MRQPSLKAFSDELTKIAIDPVTAASLLAGTKIVGSNLIARHAHRLAPLRWLGREIAGVGLRTARQGKPMLSRPMREIMAATTDPKIVGLYENAHAVGRLSKGKNLKDAQEILTKIKKSGLTRDMPDVQKATEFLSKVPTESKGFRKVVDYGFTPVGQVGKDIKGLAGGVAKDIKGLAGRAGRRVRDVFRKKAPDPSSA